MSTHISYLTATDVQMLERATLRGVDYIDFDPSAYDEEEDVD